MSEEYEIRENKLHLLNSYFVNNSLGAIVDLSLDEDPIVRAEALSFLGKTRLIDYLSVLLNGLEDPDQHVRYIAAISIGDFNEEKAIKPLVDSLKNNSEFVQCAIIESLGKIQSDQALHCLVKLLYHSNANIVKEATKSLENLLDEPACRDILVTFFSDDDENKRKFSSLYHQLQIKNKYFKMFEE